jgi:hypothetical protein
MDASSLTDTKKDLSTNDPCMIGTVWASPETDEDTKGCQEDKGTRDNEWLEASHKQNDRSENSSRYHRDKATQVSEAQYWLKGGQTCRAR